MNLFAHLEVNLMQNVNEQVIYHLEQILALLKPQNPFTSDCDTFVEDEDDFYDDYEDEEEGCECVSNPFTTFNAFV